MGKAMRKGDYYQRQRDIDFAVRDIMREFLTRYHGKFSTAERREIAQKYCMWSLEQADEYWRTALFKDKEQDDE